MRRQERLAKGYPIAISRARIYEAGVAEGASAAEVARRYGVTRAEVCQYLALVDRLPPDVVTAVEQERDPARLRLLSLRRLLGIARLPTPAKRGHAFRTFVQSLPLATPVANRELPFASQR